MMNLFRKFIYVLNRKQKIQIIILEILTIIGGAMELVGVSAVLPLVNVAMEPEIMWTNAVYAGLASRFSLKTVEQLILFLCLVLALVYIVKNAFLIYCKHYQLKVTFDVNRSISLELLDRYLRQDYLFHVSHNVAELQRNILTDVNSFTNALGAVLTLIMEGCTCILLFLYLVITDPITTTMVIGSFGAALFVFMWITKKLQLQYGQQVRDANSEAVKWLLQSFGGIKEIKVMNREVFFMDNFRRTYDKSTSANKKHRLVSMVPKHIMETIIICSLLMTMCIRILQGTEIKDFVTILSAFAIAAIRMLPAFNRITENVNVIMFNKSGFDNVYSDMKELENCVEKELSQKCDVEKLNLKKEIRIKDLTFYYPDTEKKIFDKASLTIKKNSSVAFVGESGAGKTTLVDIIIGLLKPIEGQVLVDGQNVFTHLSAWHKTIGYIPQTIYLMDDSIRANIVFGIPENEIDDDKVWRALERAELADFVRELKNGIDTEVGDRGVRLSGGQRQRIGIARALYEEPDVLILDEATSALDNETEAAVMESIDSLHGKTTLIIIAHRLSTIRNCDEIYEVEHGKINLKK